MRKTLLFLLASLMLPLVNAQELSSILETHYKAAAQEKMKKVKTMITSGINTFTTGGIQSTFMSYQARPHLLRMESAFQGSKVIQTYNGESAWRYAPAMGIPIPVEISNEEKEVLIQQAEFENRLWNYAEKGSEIELIESKDDKVFHLLFKSVDDQLIHYYIDRESRLISSIVTHQILGGSEAEIELVMEEYKTVKGIPIVHRRLTRMNGQVVVTLEIQKVEINRKIDPALFEKPVSTPSN